LAEPTWWYRLTRVLVRWVFNRFLKVQVTGLEKLPQGNYILAANHLRWIDPFLFLLYFPVRPRIYWMAASELTEGIAWRRWVIQTFGGVIPVDRTQKSASRALIASCMRVLDQGGVLGVFPEGGEGTEEGKLRGRLKRGATMFAAKTGKTIVPVGISGTRELYVGKRIRLNVGEPIEVADLDEETIHSLLTERLQAAIPPLAPNQPKKRRLERFLTYLLDDEE
jgi:1-acyl-sn-glycerol-3-phosphate acyltransferase